MPRGRRRTHADTTLIPAMVPVIPDDADPAILERRKLATACRPRHRICAEWYVSTHNRQEALKQAGYESKKWKTAWNNLWFRAPEFRAYVEYLEGQKAVEPDDGWCLNKLIKIVNDEKSPAAAKVAAIERIGRMKKVPGLCDVDQEKGSTSVTVPVKVYIGIDPEKI